MRPRQDEVPFEMMHMGRIRLNRASGCWVDLFDAADFQGNTCRLHGPAEFLGLRLRQREWGAHVESVAVGPTAYVQCFRADRSEERRVGKECRSRWSRCH